MRQNTIVSLKKMNLKWCQQNYVLVFRLQYVKSEDTGRQKFLQQGKSQGFDSYDRPSNHSNWIQIVDFSACVTLKFDGWPRKIIGHLFYITSSLVHHLKPLSKFKLELLSRNENSGENQRFFVTFDLKIWCFIKLCASFQSHWWIQTGVTVRNCPIRVKLSDFLSIVTLKFDGWPWKTIGHLFYVVSSFVRHFIAIGEYKLKLQSRNAQFGSKSAIDCPVWPWNLMNDLEKQ